MKQWRLLSAAMSALLLPAAGFGSQIILPGLPGSTRTEYQAGEFSFASVGADSMTAQTTGPFSGDRVKPESPLGTGGTMNYFFSRYLGLSVNAYSGTTSHNFVDVTSGSLIARFPIAQTGFAPYFFGGNSYRFDDVRENQAEGGAGLEFRFPHQTGTLLDISYVLPDKTDTYGIGRIGLRFNF